MIVATAVQLRVGARLLLGETSLRISEGDRIGLVGRNGAGKTTLTKFLAGEALVHLVDRSFERAVVTNPRHLESVQEVLHLRPPLAQR